MPKVIRKNWDNRFMDIANKAAEGATCQRIGFGVGCVLVMDKDPVSTGYNGSVEGDEHCIDVGCDLVDNHCKRAVHAEANAIARAAKRGAEVGGATAYITLYPCLDCMKLLSSAGISRIVYGKMYKPDERVAKIASIRGIVLEELVIQKTCCKYHLNSDHRSQARRKHPEQCRCLESSCDPCNIERIGCGCDGSFNTGCFNCTPKEFPRPQCESLSPTKAE